MVVNIARYHFTVDEYYRMAEAGIFTEDDRVELIEGEIVEMAPIGSRHAAVVDRLTRLLVARTGDRAIVRVQNPVALSGITEPQPDMVLARPRSDFYASGHPVAADVLLLIEVADTSIDYDREVKLPLYARSGVPEVWIVAIDSQTVEVYRGATEAGYEQSSRQVRGETISPSGLPDAPLKVDEILG